MSEHVTMPDMTERRKTHDDEYAFRGIWNKEPEGRCRVRILEDHGRPPTLVLTELDDNPSTSVTNLIEVLAAELIAKYFPVRFEAVGENPITLIEHYPARSGARGTRALAPTYDRVDFASWVPQRVWLGGQERLSLGEPAWRHLPAHEVRALLGDEAADLFPASPPTPDGHLEGSHNDGVSEFVDD